jgi:nucleoside-diphosphate-sugar epimerase
VIKGRGMLAKAFASYNEQRNIIIFAQGVSNSQEKDEANFKRESNILQSALNENKEKLIVYFGTCSVDDPSSKSSPYVVHKLKMEKLVQESGLDYYIFRLPQVVGRTTSPTLIHYLSMKIRDGEFFNVWKNSTRNLIDVEDCYKICSYLIDNDIFKNTTINVATNSSVGIIDIVKEIEGFLQKQAIYNVVDKGDAYPINIARIQPYLEACQVSFKDDYLIGLLKKYYAEYKVVRKCSSSSAG